MLQLAYIMCLQRVRE